MMLALKDRTHPGHYWWWITLSWSLSIMLAFPALNLSWQQEAVTPLLVVAMIPILAHGYALFANFGALRDFKDVNRVGPALTGASYGLGVIGCMFFMPPSEALYLPFTGIFVSILSIGIFFTGLTPLLGFWLTKYVLNKRFSHLSVLHCLIIMMATWVISGVNAQVLSFA